MRSSPRVTGYSKRSLKRRSRSCVAWGMAICPPDHVLQILSANSHFNEANVPLGNRCPSGLASPKGAQRIGALNSEMWQAKLSVPNQDGSQVRPRSRAIIDARRMFKQDVDFLFEWLSLNEALVREEVCVCRDTAECHNWPAPNLLTPVRLL